MDRYDPSRDPRRPADPARPGEPTRAAPLEDRPTQAMPSLERGAPQRPEVGEPAGTRAGADRPTVAQSAARGDIAPVTKKQPVQVRRLRRGRLAIRKISPWSTFKFSLVFYFCMLLIVLLGTAIIFAALKAFGVIDNIEKLLRDLEFDVTISGGLIFRWMFLLGLVGTVVASAITVFMAFLYNLIADVVGGIELLVTERE